MTKPPADWDSNKQPKTHSKTADLDGAQRDLPPGFTPARFSQQCTYRCLVHESTIIDQTHVSLSSIGFLAKSVASF